MRSCGRPGGSARVGVCARRLALIVLATLAPSACSTLSDVAPDSEALALTQGPLRWLLLPEEERQARELRTAREAADFQRAFWLRRCGPGETPEKLARTFTERVDAADRLYGGEEVRGSLSERGRALVLLGPPPVLRYGQRRVPTWAPNTAGTSPNMRTRTLVVETWVYPLSDLPPAVAAAVREEGADDVSVVFLLAKHEVHLLDGERVLQKATRALVVR